MRAFIKFADKISGFFGYIAAWLSTLLIVVIMYDVFTRYFLRKTAIWVQELEWHLFAMMIMLGIAYTLRENAHVRVDVIYSKLKPKTKAAIDIAGVIILLIPLSLLIIYTGYDFMKVAWESRECSPDPGGLPGRYILKAFIPFGFVLMINQGISMLFKAILTLQGDTSFYKAKGGH